MRTLVRALCVVVLSPVLLHAQNDIHRPTREQNQKNGTARLAARFSGRWKINDKSEPSTEYPNRLVRIGEERWYTLPGSIPLIEEYYSQSPDGVDEHDSAAFWWDGIASKYLGLFCAHYLDQGCTPFEIVWHTKAAKDASEGNRSGTSLAQQDEIVMSGEYLQHGKKVVWREVFLFSSPAAFTQTLFLGESGSELKRAAVISAARIGDTTSADTPEIGKSVRDQLAGAKRTKRKPSGPAANVAMVFQAYSAALLRGDADEIEKLTTAGFLWTHGTEEVEVREQHIASIRAGELKYVAIKNDPASTTLYGDSAILTGRSVRQYSGDKPFSIRYTAVIVRDMGVWRLAALHTSYCPCK